MHKGILLAEYIRAKGEILVIYKRVFGQSSIITICILPTPKPVSSQAAGNLSPTLLILLTLLNHRQPNPSTDPTRTCCPRLKLPFLVSSHRKMFDIIRLAIQWPRQMTNRLISLSHFSLPPLPTPAVVVAWRSRRREKLTTSSADA